ncbi:MAG: class I SAM-dependent methyltransferase [Rubrivivax sp.]|nr:class I SAM-dependent methyltransferase [Rubrivivax sp.]
MLDDYSEWKGWSAAEFGRHTVHDDRYFRWHVGRALPSSAQALQVLELGFGNGRFLGWCRDSGHGVVGVETNPRLREIAYAQGYEAAASVDELEATRRFDLIAAFDVMEHIEAERMPEFLRQLASRLKPGGRMLLRFPNGESPFGLSMQQGDLTHRQALGVGKFKQLSAACGLQLLHSGEGLPWQALPRSRALGALFWWSLRKVFERLLRKMYHLPRELDLSANQLVVLGQA